MSLIKTVGQAISLTAKVSSIADVTRSTKDRLSVHLEMTGAETAWDAKVEGRYWVPEFAAVTLIDNADADTEALFLGGLLDEFHGAPITLGQRFVVDTANDTTDDALETAKGSPPVSGDIFQIVAIAAELAFVANQGFATLIAFAEDSSLFTALIPYAPYIRVRSTDTWTASEILGLHISY